MKLYISTLTIFAVLATSHAQNCKMNKSAQKQQQGGSGIVSPALANGAAAAPAGQASPGTAVNPVLANPAAPQVSAQASAASNAAAAATSSTTMSQFPEPSNYPGQNTGVGRGPTGKCLYGRTYCGYSIRDLHTYDDLKEVYCNSNLCPFEDCGNGKVCNPTEEQVFQSVYQCDDLVADYEGTSVYFLGACAGSAGWVCANPEPHCTTPRRARLLARSLQQ